MMAAVFALLLTVAVVFPAHLDEIANPADANYMPRPEWDFLSLFQLLKYFPGPLELVATQVVPALVVGGMFALPFLDRGASRHPWAPSRRAFTVAHARGGGRRFDAHLARPRGCAHALRPEPLGPPARRGVPARRGRAGAVLAVSRGGRAGVAGERYPHQPRRRLAGVPHERSGNDCARRQAARRHVHPMLDDDQTRSVLAYLRRTRAGGTPPTVSPSAASVIGTLGTRCVACHTFDGDGGDTGPDLTHVGARRDEAEIRRIITDPNDEYGDSMMPVYGSRLSAGEIAALARYLAARQ